MSGTSSQSRRLQSLRVVATSTADELGYLAQQAISLAITAEDDYRIVGGHMVRLLLEVYPTPAATPRSTLDADAAVGDIEVIGPLARRLMAQNFIKEGGNLFRKQADGGGSIEINVLLSRFDHSPGMRPRAVAGVGQVDSLPELHWAMLNDP